MMWFLIILLMLVSLMLLMKWRTPAENIAKPNPFDGETPLPYTRRSPMTETELYVYDLLLESLPNYMIFPQVQASRVLESPAEDNLYWFNFINRLSYDFVICRMDGTPIAAIEVDDATHDLPEREAADNRKNLATAAAGIEMIRWDVRHIPTERVIAKMIARADQNAAV